MSQESSRYLAEKRFYKTLSVLAGMGTVLGLLTTFGLVCGVGLNLLQNTSQYQPNGTLSPDIIPAQLVCSGASALFTIASGFTWAKVSDKADEAERMYQHSLPPAPKDFDDDGYHENFGGGAWA